MKNEMQILIESALLRTSLKKSDLARELGIAPSTLHGRLQTGKFTYEELEKIADIMNCTLHVSFEPKK